MQLSLPLLAFSQDFERQATRSELLTKRQFQEERVGGVIDVSDLKIGFLNNGRFCPPEEIIPELPSAFYEKYGYLSKLDLWVGIPDGPWAPQVWDESSQRYISAGPTVSGTLYEYWVTDTDWSTISGTRGVFYTGELQYSDLYRPSSLFDFPLAAMSEDERTWPRNSFTGYREWPGRRKIDVLTGETIPGSFLGDQDIFLAFDDKTLADQMAPTSVIVSNNGRRFQPQKGYPIGAEVLAQVFSYQSGYLANTVFFDLKIINTSQWNYHDVYLGLYYESDNPSYDLNRPDLLTTRVREKMSYIKNDTTDVGSAMFPFNMAYSYAYRDYYEYNAGYLGVQLLKTPMASADQIDNDGDGWVDEPEGEQLGLTGWHYFEPNVMMYAGERERLQYQILAGDTTGFSDLVQQRRVFFSRLDGSFDPHYDTSSLIKSGYYQYGEIPHVYALLSTGPTDWASGDTLSFVFAVLVGENQERLETSAQIARQIVDFNYTYSSAPLPPQVTAVAQDGKVTLYWDRSAESAEDFITGYADFEGYKIYRTTVDPAENMWGQAIYDHDNNIVNYMPVASCDLENGIHGYEKVYPFQKLGEDTGLFHSWTDTTVTNGVTYWYSVCAYDHGIVDDEDFNPKSFPPSPLNECVKGADPKLNSNLVQVVPGVQAVDYETPRIQFEALAATSGNGPIEVTIVDPFKITGHDYTMTFEDTTYGYAVYNLYDETVGEMKLEKVQQTGGEEGVICDGLQIHVERYDDMEVLNDRTFWYNYETGEPSKCTWSIFGGKLTWDPFPYEYDIIFTGEMDTSVFMKRTAPFKIWNTVLDKPALWDIYWNYSGTDTTDSLVSTWSSGDMIYIWDQFDQENEFTLRVTISERSVYTYQGLMNIPPKTGDAVHIALKRMFRTGDQFRISTKAMEKAEARKNRLNDIKVVPNPYVVGADWELGRNDSRIQFIHLPSECTIHIYTLAGDKVRTLHHNNPNTDYEFWDLLNFSNLKASYGLYVYVVETPDGKATTGKFVILR
ncbi:MAG: hypothetical protein ACOY90_14325 [Candidatus Zhuqueibacterota bacterium]